MDMENELNRKAEGLPVRVNDNRIIGASKRGFAYGDTFSFRLDRELEKFVVLYIGEILRDVGCEEYYFVRVSDSLLVVCS
jgi:hypothetical protein